MYYLHHLSIVDAKDYILRDYVAGVVIKEIVCLGSRQPLFERTQGGKVHKLS